MLLFCCCLIDAKKKKGVNLFGKKKSGKKKVTTTTAATTIKPEMKRTEVIASKVANISSFLSAHPSATAVAAVKVAKKLDTKKKLDTIKKLDKKKKLYKKKYHNKTNLKLVYKSVLPVGMKRPDDNVIFEYTDNEEGKTCRCICRMK